LLSSYYQRYEKDEVTPTVSVLEALASKYKVNLNWLLTGQGNMFASSDDIYATLAPELIEFFRQIPPEAQKKFVEFFKDTLEFLSKSSQTSFSHKSKELLKSNS
jgi:transcriptional regulator with XRE-family HTH domain